MPLRGLLGNILGESQKNKDNKKLAEANKVTDKSMVLALVKKFCGKHGLPNLAKGKKTFQFMFPKYLVV